MFARIQEACQTLSWGNFFGRTLPCVLLVASLAGCIRPVGPDYEQPDVVVADRWHQDIVEGLAEGDADYQTWWQALEDPQLDSLISRAGQNNLDLKLAYARIAEARAQLGIAKGERYPDLDGFGASQRQRLSEGVSGLVPPPAKRTDTFRDIGVEAIWELDLWGRVRRSVESAEANYEASLENYRDVMVVLFADVGSNYLLLRALQERLRLALANVELQRETLKLVEARNKAELAPKLEVRQAELNLATTESAVPALQAAIVQTINRIGVLLGEQPGVLHAELQGSAPIPGPPASVATGIPADLVRRRPDVRLAERNLAAQTARIGIATAALYPNFFIAGDFSYLTASGSLFDSGNQSWSLGPFFSWNLFDGGRVRSAIDVEEARTEQLLAIYEQTVLRALQDVDDSLVGYAEERKRLAALERSEIAAADATRLVNELYKRGLTDFQNVLDTERSLFGQQDLLAESKGNVMLNLISIYRSLGGGWANDETP
jgi:NodT family efflux transporter outer membrane factor (OMF) lipoprotein